MRKANGSSTTRSASGSGSYVLAARDRRDLRAVWWRQTPTGALVRVGDPPYPGAYEPARLNRAQRRRAR